MPDRIPSPSVESMDMEPNAPSFPPLTFNEMLYGDLDLQVPLEYIDPEAAQNTMEVDQHVESDESDRNNVLNEGRIGESSVANSTEIHFTTAEESAINEARLIQENDTALIESQQGETDQTNLQTSDLLNEAIVWEDTTMHHESSKPAIEDDSPKPSTSNAEGAATSVGTPKRPNRSTRRSMSTEPIKRTKREEDDQQPSTSKASSSQDTPSKPVRRNRSTSFNVEQAQRESTSKSPGLKSTRAKSASVTNLNSSATPVKRRTSKSSLDVKDAEDHEPTSATTPSRPKSRRMSAVLDAISETPKSPRASRRKTISESSDIDKQQGKDAEAKEDVPATPRRGRKPKDTSDTESIVSTRSRRSVDRGGEGYQTPTTRSKTRQLEEISPDSQFSGSPKTQRSTRRAGSKKIDDDANSEASSMISNRSQTRRKGSKTPADDDLMERSSIKSGVSTRRSARAASVVNLPSIAENATDSSTADASANMDVLTSSRRLTRAQLATMEKYKSLERKPDAQLTPSRMRTRRASALSEMDEDREGSGDSDAESMTSKDSNVTKMSNTSKASRASKRGRPKKN